MSFSGNKSLLNYKNIFNNEPLAIYYKKTGLMCVSIRVNVNLIQKVLELNLMLITLITKITNNSFDLNKKL